MLLNSRQRHTSGSSDGSRAEASGTMSPVNMDKEEGKEKSKFAQVLDKKKKNSAQNLKIFSHL